jgi:membrane associated rhomboid family serine protease
MRVCLDVWPTYARRARRFCTIISRPRTKWEELKEFASHFSPRTKPELRFDNFPRQPGHEVTLGVIFGINVAVFAGWHVPQLQDLWSHLFLWSNWGLKEGRLWLLVTPSFSHQDLSHLVANMTFFLYLGKRLHQFMGRARFVALYLAGSAAGTIASDLNPGYRPDRVEATPARYLNILNGQPTGTAESLGASDAVMAILACWYLVFPRTQIHVFRTVSMLTDFMRARGFKKVTAFLDRYHPTCSALWFLPLVFVSDFLTVMGLNPTTATSHLSMTDNTNVSSHVAGFAAGSLFHLVVTRPLKAQHFARNWYEISRRAILIPASLTVYGVAFYKLKQMELEKQGLAAVRFELDPFVDKSTTPGPDWQSMIGKRQTADFVRAPPQLMKLLREADTCSAREAYMIHRTASKSELDKDHKLSFGQCDALFRRVRQSIQASDTSTAEEIIRSVRLKEASPNEKAELEKWALQTERAQRVQSMSWAQYVSFVLRGKG